MSSNTQRLLYGVGTGLGVSLLSGLTYWYYQHYKRNVIPTQWRRIGTLAQINIFPVKSCGSLKLNGETEVPCETLGLRLDNVRDRALMLINDRDEMVTARGYPKMVLIETQVIGPTILLLSAQGVQSLELDFATLVEEAPGKDVRTSVWGTQLDAMLCGEKYDRWFSQVVLNQESGLRLVYFPYPKPVRAINQRLTTEPFITRQDTGTFPDATSYMLINLASVDELNTRLERPVDPLQFRGNFHLKMDTDQPYAEDKWRWMKIGEDAIFCNVAPCTRCILPNINVVTGERDPDGEPLKTLRTYRMTSKYPSPVMGIHLGLRQAGAVKLNDVVYVADV